MPTFYSPTGNAEVWEHKPDGYMTPEEWQAAQPVHVPTAEELAQQAAYEAEQARMEAERKAEAQRIPDLEDATVDLAEYIAELEQRIAELEEAKENA